MVTLLETHVSSSFSFILYSKKKKKKKEKICGFASLISMIMNVKNEKEA